jgi:hypothetical protein
VDFWKKSNVTAELIQATTSMAMHAQDEKTKTLTPGGAPASQANAAYAAKTYAKAKELIVDHPDRLCDAKGRRVLWMDSPGANRFEQDLFQAFGISIDCSSDPGQAIRQLQGAGLHRLWMFRSSSVYSAVITNFGNGRAFDLIKEMRRRGLQVPAIIYSPGVTSADVESARKRGALGETQDPVELAELLFKAFERPRTRLLQ